MAQAQSQAIELHVQTSAPAAAAQGQGQPQIVFVDAHGKPISQTQTPVSSQTPQPEVVYKAPKAGAQSENSSDEVQKESKLEKAQGVAGVLGTLYALGTAGGVTDIVAIGVGEAQGKAEDKTDGAEEGDDKKEKQSMQMKNPFRFLQFYLTLLYIQYALDAAAIAEGGVMGYVAVAIDLFKYWVFSFYGQKMMAEILGIQVKGRCVCRWQCAFFWKYLCCCGQCVMYRACLCPSERDTDRMQAFDPKFEKFNKFKRWFAMIGLVATVVELIVWLATGPTISFGFATTAVTAVQTGFLFVWDKCT